MRVTLVAADLEENLGIGMIAAVAEAGGHRVEIVPFNGDEPVEEVALRVESSAPELVGLGLQFQHRAGDCIALARALRRNGFGGHLTAGGQYATPAWRRVLQQGTGVDSVVLRDGEETFAALLAALERGAPLDGVAGLALAGADGAPRKTPPRGLVRDLNRLPYPRRYRRHAVHVGVPFVPVLGSRGCWGRCRFCSITSFYREGQGAALRFRSPENLAAEMALLWFQAGGRAVFCFHDDNLLLPRPADSLARLRELRAALDRHGVGRIAIVGKCRPDSMSPELARELRQLGVIRLFVGVENGSQPGLDHLGRGVAIDRVHAAVDACRDAGIFCCYNLLLFEPGATLADVEQNVAFMRRHAHFPVNFCRAEAYAGTELHRDLQRAGKLRGPWDSEYRIDDERTEVLFRICAAVFRERNFGRRGVHNRYMGLGYTAKLLEQFYAPRDERDALIEEAGQLTRAITLESAAFLEQALALAQQIDPGERDRIERQTAVLALAVAAADRQMHARLDRLFERIDACAYRQLAATPPRRQRREGLWRSARRLAQALALAGLVGGGAAAIGACDNDRAVTDASNSDTNDIWPTDDAPHVIDDIWPTDDAPHSVLDTIWPTDDAPHPDGMVVDPAPPDMGPDAGGPKDAGVPQASLGGEPVDRWTDSAPRRSQRSPDLPLHDPPRPELRAERRGEALAVELCCDATVTTRWEGDGRIVVQPDDERRVLWTPECETDQLRVGVRSAGGVAVATLRALDVA